ncbi:hypothetical protein EVAR_55076_1 [Eumeta japonica]|uniref:Uncharacterized protein n=1 Tax=Eumeta variegata TaxID=151549 RepID=A0A4C1YZX0_EUMVA|nr:hypothetical protein EVAR_55076_1 [Eumeta japonica]
MKFAVPRIWREPTDHINDCYFCVVNPHKRRAGKNAKKIQSPDLPPTTTPVSHSERFPEPSRSNTKEQLPPSQVSSSSGCSELLLESVSVEPPIINSEELNDLEFHHFHRDVMNFERRCQGQYNENMMGD